MLRAAVRRLVASKLERLRPRLTRGYFRSLKANGKISLVLDALIFHGHADAPSQVHTNYCCGPCLVATTFKRLRLRLKCGYFMFVRHVTRVCQRPCRMLCAMAHDGA